MLTFRYEAAASCLSSEPKLLWLKYDNIAALVIKSVVIVLV